MSDEMTKLNVVLLAALREALETQSLEAVVQNALNKTTLTEEQIKTIITQAALTAPNGVPDDLTETEVQRILGDSAAEYNKRSIRH